VHSDRARLRQAVEQLPELALDTSFQQESSRAKVAVG
jgi:hypothetical protein